MKKITLIRHAKAQARRKGLTDKERTLLPKGLKKTQRTIRILKKEGIKPDLILTSPALRALKTARMIAKALDFPVKAIQVEDRLYDAAESESLFQMLRAIPDDHSHVMIVGHNPALNQLAAVLVNTFQYNIPKSGVVTITFKQNTWKGVTQRNGMLVLVDFPVNKNRMVRVVGKELAGKLSKRITDFFKEIDPTTADKMDASIKAASQKLARRFSGYSKNLKNDYLEIKAGETKSKRGRQGSQKKTVSRKPSEKVPASKQKTNQKKKEKPEELDQGKETTKPDDTQKTEQII